MKNMLLTAIFSLFVAGMAMAQTNPFKNLSYGDKAENTLYLGVDNILVLTDSSYVVQPREGLVIKDGKIYLRPTNMSDFVVNLQTPDSLMPVTYMVKMLPVPQAHFEGIDTNFVSIAQLENPNQVLIVEGPAEFEGFYDGYEISSFVVEYSGQTYEQKGNKLSKELLDALKQNSDQTLTLSRVKAKHKDTGKPLFLYGTQVFNIGQ